MRIRLSLATNLVNVGKAVCPSLSLVQGYDHTVSRNSSTPRVGRLKKEALATPTTASPGHVTY